MKTALGRWEWFGYISTAVVGLGCVGECIAEFTSLPRSDQRKHKLARLSLMVLILGIAGELLSAVRTSQLSGQIIANIEERAADAEQKAGEANDRAALNEKEAAQLQKDAEAEHLARVKIEAAVAWRQLSEKDERDIGTAVTGFKSSVAASVWFNASSTEAEIFADDIAQALRDGKIIVQPPGGIMEMRESGKFGEPIKRPLTGVIVQSTEDKPARDLAASLMAELNRRGFDAVKQTDPPFGKGKFPQIWVNVEPRPKGPQGEYKLQAEREDKAKKKTNANKYP
ncbi:MAG: hypothetical protein ACLP3K_07580 [Candidatus Acidiferrales bacterium]